MLSPLLQGLTSVPLHQLFLGPDFTALPGPSLALGPLTLSWSSILLQPREWSSLPSEPLFLTPERTAAPSLPPHPQAQKPPPGLLW